MGTPSLRARRGEFERAVRRYWPGLPRGALMPGYTGCRVWASLLATSRSTDPNSTVWRMFTLYGIESPGLTSSLAIAEYVLERLG